MFFASYSWASPRGHGFGNVTVRGAPSPNTQAGLENLKKIIAEEAHVGADASIVILFWRDIEDQQ